MNLKVKQFVNGSMTSNAYVVHYEDSVDCVLVDIGEYTELRKHLEFNNLNVLALFLTHSHYDHILGIREFRNEFPNAIIYAHCETIKSLNDAKLNLSFYRDVPIEVDIPPQNRILIENQDIEIASLNVSSIHTPGHNLGSLSFVIDSFLFTGDSLIPGHKIVTKLKGGDKDQAHKSLVRLIDVLVSVKYLAPGHGKILCYREFKSLVAQQKRVNCLT